MCLLGTIVTLLLKRQNPELAVCAALAVCGVAACYVLQKAETVVTLLETMTQTGGISDSVIEPLLKTTGIALISKAGAELCRDAGQGAMASIVETAGAFCAIVVAAPLFGAVWELLRGILL